MRCASGSLPPGARNSNTWPSPSGGDDHKEGGPGQRPRTEKEEEQLAQKIGSCLLQHGWDPERGSGAAATQTGPTPSGSSPDCALPRRRDGARADGRVQDPICSHGARSTSRPPARGRPAGPAPPPPLPGGGRAQAASDPSCHSSLLLFPLPVWHGIICAESC